MAGNKARILVLDIENSPNLSYTWGKYEQDVIAFEKEWYMLSFSYKWLGEKTKVLALPDFKNYKKNKEDDSALVSELRDLLDEADIVIGHNVDRFDLRKINTRMLHAGMKVPSPYQTVDTLSVARSRFFLNSNKLGDVAEFLGIGEKAETGGFQLWLDCMAGEKKAWEKMKNYNKHDVDLTEKVYAHLLPWVRRHPNVAVIENRPDACPNCGGAKLTARGWGNTRTMRRRRYQCEGCGAWSYGPAEKR